MLFELWVAFVSAFWILFPAYAANVFPPFAKGKHPVDFRKKIKTRRIFGDGKTWEGIAVGLFAGFLVGVLEAYLYPGFNAYANQFGISLPAMNLTIAFLIPLGALVGDIIGSLIKRRLNMKRGSDAPLLDQLDFVVGAIIFTCLFIEYSLAMIVIMLVATFLIHRAASIIGYWLKVKREPW